MLSTDQPESTPLGSVTVGGIVVSQVVTILPVLEIGLKIDCLAQRITGPNNEVRQAPIFDIRCGIARTNSEPEDITCGSGSVSGLHG